MSRDQTATTSVASKHVKEGHSMLLVRPVPITTPCHHSSVQVGNVRAPCNCARGLAAHWLRSPRCI